MTKFQKIDRKIIKHLSTLASLPLSPSEELEFENSLSKALGYVGTVQELNLENVKETAQVTGKVNELRQDEIEPSLSQKQALSQSRKSTQNGYFIVPQVISHE